MSPQRTFVLRREPDWIIPPEQSRISPGAITAVRIDDESRDRGLLHLTHFLIQYTETPGLTSLFKSLDGQQLLPIQRPSCGSNISVETPRSLQTPRQRLWSILNGEFTQDATAGERTPRSSLLLPNISRIVSRECVSLLMAAPQAAVSMHPRPRKPQPADEIQSQNYKVLPPTNAFKQPSCPLSLTPSHSPSASSFRH
jgi:hypothetical protein